MRILIAEDDLIGRMLLQRFLSTYGTCDVSVDGLETLDLYFTALNENDPYHVIFLDIMMPKLDGVKVLKIIRDIEIQKGIHENSRVKIIMTTALNDQKTVKESYDSGCEAYIWKPIDLEKLKEVMENLNLT